MKNGTSWPRSCFNSRHKAAASGNSGESAVAKGGRSAERRAVPSFFVALVLAAGLAFPGHTAGQRPAVSLRVGGAGSTALAEDRVASDLLRAQVGRPVAEGVEARPALAPGVELAAAFPLRPRVAGEVALGWSRASLRAEEPGGAGWDAGDLELFHATLMVRWRWRPALAVSGGFGAVRYVADGAALFADGAELSPAVQGAAELGLPWWGGRTGVRAFAQMHRFNTPALRRAGASDGSVLRAGVQATVRLLDGGRS